MYIKDYLEKFDERKVKLFVDMDGVIADYVVGEACNYNKKRPLYSNIEKLEKVSEKDNVELYILSVSRMNVGVKEKNEWLDKFAPFFKKENRVIIPREENEFMSAVTLKSNYVKNLERDNSSIVVIDDDPRILHEIQENCKDVFLLKDTVLVD